MKNFTHAVQPEKNLLQEVMQRFVWTYLSNE